MCNLGMVEDLFHLVMECGHYTDIRQCMFDEIRMGVTYDSWQHFETLSDKLVYYILLGMCYPLLQFDMWSLRTISCQSIRKMYIRRTLMV